MVSLAAKGGADRTSAPGRHHSVPVTRRRLTSDRLHLWEKLKAIFPNFSPSGGDYHFSPRSLFCARSAYSLVGRKRGYRAFHWFETKLWNLCPCRSNTTRVGSNGRSNLDENSRWPSMRGSIAPLDVRITTVIARRALWTSAAAYPTRNVHDVYLRSRHYFNLSPGRKNKARMFIN